MTKILPQRLNETSTDNLIKIQNLTIIIVSQYHIFKSQQERALIQSLCDRRASDQTWDGWK